ncbi:UDP-2,4-diacetamido-2,4,6-trideoxy-beta-L-altropyranose hydrolase [Pelagibacterales bacterium SAG-MED32]|nr:UDP-2,4-diacetamido-2,4,6-trideoxy-beta-L-altropyranose hydrolase [Pelagibacterales bacterium SAG-MED32]
MSPIKHILFRVDAYEKIGSGHFYRCLTLANELKKSKLHIDFAGSIESKYLIKKLNQNKIHFHRVPKYNKIHKSKRQINDSIKILEIIAKKHYDLVVLDNYQYDYKWEKIIKKHVNYLMVIDDLANRKHHCDLLLDQTFGRKRKDYHKLLNSDCKQLLGSRYFLLREEFKKKVILKKTNKIVCLISFGGADPQNLTLKIYNALENLHYIDEFIIIIGPLAKQFTKKIKSKKHKIIQSTNNISKYILNSSIVIGASGGSTWERLYMGANCFQFVVAKNQKKAAEDLDAKGYIKLVNNSKELKFQLMEWLNGKLKFKKFNHIDELGVKRVVDKILSLSKL